MKMRPNRCSCSTSSGSPRRLLAPHAPPARPRRRAAPGPAGHRAARRHLHRAVHLPHRRAARRARHRRQRLVLPRAGGGAAVAAAQRAGRRGEAVGRGPRAASPATRSPTSAGGTRWAPTPTGPSPRARSTTPTAARSPTATPVRPLHDELTDALGTFPLFTFWGPGADIASSQWIAAPPARSATRRPRPDPGLHPAPRLRPPALRPRRPALPPRGRRTRRRARPVARRRRAAGRAPSSRSPSTASPGSPAPSTSTVPCAGPGCWRCTPRTAWSTWTRGPPAPSPSPTTRSRTSTCATRPTCRPPAKRSPDSTASPRSSTSAARRPTGWTTRARASWSPSPSPTPGSPTTTGWTTTAPPTSPAWSRSTASPATTRPSCSWTRWTRTCRLRAATALARKKIGMRYRMAVVPLDPSPVRGSHGRLPERTDQGPVFICSRPGAAEGPLAATDVKPLLLDLALGELT